MDKEGELAELIRQTSLLIWDEAPMMHKFNYEALDRTLRDVREDPRPCLPVPNDYV